MDFQKALHKLMHSRPTSNIETCDANKAITWILTRQSSRQYQRVLVNNVSHWRNVNHGVPQGTLVGTLLYSIDINNLDLGLQGTISKFADDIKHGSLVFCKEDSDRLEQI